MVLEFPGTVVATEIISQKTHGNPDRVSRVR